MIIEKASLSVKCMSTIFAVTLASLTGFANFGIGIAQGQVNSTSSSLTTQQKAAMCNPNNPKLNFVNSTESEICGIPPTPTNTTTTTPAANNNNNNNNNNNTRTTSLYDQGYAKGVADAKSVKITTPPSGTMSPDDVDCDSSIDPQASNVDYCSGYQHGFADTYNNELVRK
jgi:hypothetical protein